MWRQNIKVTVIVTLLLAVCVTAAATISIANGYNADASWGALVVVAITLAWLGIASLIGKRRRSQ
jgi:hypothetical protein